MTFSEYLVSKKIDEKAFAQAEPDVFAQWKREFEEMHPNSFTMQKLNLINPIRRNYPLAQVRETASSPAATPPSQQPGVSPKSIMKPVFKPKKPN